MIVSAILFTRQAFSLIHISFLSEEDHRKGLLLNVFIHHIFRFNVAERAQWNGTFVTSSEIITTDSEDCDYPIVFESAPDACSQSCDQFCFPQ